MDIKTSYTARELMNMSEDDFIKLTYEMDGKHAYFENPKIKERTFGDWHVSEEGDMEFQDGRYFISSDRLTQDNWILHLMSKKWINFNEFIPAYFHALNITGNTTITLRIKYQN